MAIESARMKPPAPTAASDTAEIYIDDLRVACIIGIYDWEREVPQTVNISLRLPAGGRAFHTDQLRDAVDYKTLTKTVIALVSNSRYQLIERLAEAIAQLCLRKFGLAWVRLRLEKPGALRGARTVGLEIYRAAPPRQLTRRAKTRR